MAQITQNPTIDRTSVQGAPGLYYLADGAAIFGCVGNPEGLIVANRRSLALSDNGNIYYKTTDGVATGWIAIGGGGGGSIGGSITVGQVAFGTAPNVIGGNNNLLYDSVIGGLVHGLTTTVTPGGTSCLYQEIQTPDMSFPIEFFAGNSTFFAGQIDHNWSIQFNRGGVSAAHPRWGENIEVFFNTGGQNLIEKNWDYTSIGGGVSYRPFNFNVDMGSHDAEMLWRLGFWRVYSRTSSAAYLDMQTPTNIFNANTRVSIDGNGVVAGALNSPIFTVSGNQGTTSFATMTSTGVFAANAVALSVNTANVPGVNDYRGIQATGNTTAKFAGGYFQNVNAGAGADCFVEVATGSGGGGDGYIKYTKPGSYNYAWGYDASADRFKLTTADNPSAGTSLIEITRTTFEVSIQSLLAFAAERGAAGTAAGSLWRDNGSKGLALRRGNNVNYLTGMIYASTADRVVANTAVATSLLATTFVGSASLAGSGFNNGNVLKFTLRGVYSTDGAAATTLRIRVLIFGVAVGDTGAVNVPIGVTNGQWELQFNAIHRGAPSAASPVAAQGKMQVQTGALVFTPDIYPLSNTAPVNVNSGTGGTLDVTAQWGAADPDNTITCSTCIIEFE